MSAIVPWELELLHIKDNKCCFADSISRSLLNFSKKQKESVIF